MARLKTPKDISLYIKQTRKSQGLSQQQLADKIGVSRSWVINAEKGKPTLELNLVLKTLDVLNINLTANRIGISNSAALPLEFDRLRKPEENKTITPIDALRKLIEENKTTTPIDDFQKQIEENKK